MPIHKILLTFCVILSTFLFSVTFAQTPSDALGIRLEGYAYPYPVKYFNLKVENKSLQMAYMDVPPTGKLQHQTVVLLHGGLAFGAYWKDTIKFLSENGFRVIVPDQLGFGKSSKENIHYSLYILARSTKELLNHLRIHQAIIVGHSLGGMLATRFTLMYPETVSKLLLEDPLGLEDYRLRIPFKSTGAIYQLSLHPTWMSILNTHKALYANWDDKYEEYAQVAYRVSLNPKYTQVALVQALIYEMIYSDPVVYELKNIKVPALLVFGYQDRTAPVKGFASKDTQKALGNFPVLTKNAVSIIPNAKVIGFENVGHVPHLEATKQFNARLYEFITEKTRSD